MTPEVEANLRRKAKQFLASARFLVETDAESSVSRAYYAMYSQARVLMGRDGLTSKTHRGLHIQFSNAYVQTGKVPESLGAAFRLAWRHREEADYVGLSDLGAEGAARTLERAERFIAHLDSLLDA